MQDANIGGYNVLQFDITAQPQRHQIDVDVVATGIDRHSVGHNNLGHAGIAICQNRGCIIRDERQ